MLAYIGLLLIVAQQPSPLTIGSAAARSGQTASGFIDVPAGTTDMRPMLDCDAVMRQLWDYLDGELTPARTEAIREHLALCARCFPQLEFERAFRHTRPDGSRTRELRGASGPRRLGVAHRRIRGVIPG